MKLKTAATLILALTASLPLSCNAAPDAKLQKSIQKSIYTARDQVFPALVNIETTTRQIYQGQAHKGLGTGSGSIISKDGYVVTNAHVVEHGVSFICTLSDNQEIPATLVGSDPLTDIAVLKLDLTKEINQGKNLVIAQFGDSDKLESSDAVMAMGSPLSLSKSISKGVVSNTQRILILPEQAMAMPTAASTGFLTIWIQHDALINPGNSGGPLVDLQGKIIGVNARGGSSMGFAIPANQAKKIANTLIKHGTVDRSWIGASLKTTKDTGLTNGVLVNSVVQKSPAQIAGLQPGDLITHINDIPVNASNNVHIPTLLNTIANTPINGNINFKITRNPEKTDNQKLTIKIKTQKLPTKFGEKSGLRKWGTTVQEITPWVAQLRKLDSTNGVIVQDIAQGSVLSLAKPPVPRGAIITKIDDKKTNTLDDMINAYESLTKKYKEDHRVILHYTLRQQNYITLLKVQHDKEEPPVKNIPKSWVGITTQPILKKLADKLTGETSRGFLVTRIYKETNAQKSELKVGDIITKVNEKRIIPNTIADAPLFDREIRRLEDDQVTLQVLRDKKNVTVKIELQFTKDKPSQATTQRNRDFGITVRTITFFDRADNQWDKTAIKGVIVSNLEGPGWAARAGIRHYDLIQKIDNHEIKSLKSFRKAMKKITTEKPKRIIIQILRGQREQFIYIEPQWSPTKEKEEN